MNGSTNDYEPLNRIIVHQLQTLYQSQLGHYPNHISCQLHGTTLAIVVEHPLTKVEQLLMIQGYKQLAEQVRTIFDRMIRTHLITIIEETVDVKVIDLLIDTHFDVNQASAIAILSSIPSMIRPAAIDSLFPRFSDSQPNSGDISHLDHANLDHENEVNADEANANEINADDDE